MTQHLANSEDDSARNHGRSWRQFGLRSLLAVFTLAILLAGAWTNYVVPWKEREAIRVRIEALGASYESRPGPSWIAFLLGEEHCRVITEVRFPPRRFTVRPTDDSLFRSISLLTDLERVEVQGQNITDEVLSHWSTLQRLRHLDLTNTLVENPDKWPDWPLETLTIDGTRMSDEQISKLAKYKTLKALFAPSTGFGDNSVQALADLPQLNELDVALTRITPASWATLSRYPALDPKQTLPWYERSYVGEGRVVPHLSKYQDGQPGVAIADLPAPEVVAAAYQQAMRMSVESQYEMGSCYCLGIDALYVDTMGVLPGIRELDLSSPYVDDELLGCLVQFPNLEVLQLRGSWITDEGLRHLANCPNLLSLSLQDTQITDAALMRLAQTCPKLEVLRLSGTQVTHRGLADLTGLADLRFLFIPLGALRGKELRQLEKLPQLDHLRVAHPGVWDTHSRVSAPLNREDVMSLQALLKYLHRPHSRPWRETFQLLRRDQYYSEDALSHGLCRWLTFTPEAFELLTKEQQQTVVESRGREPLW